MAVGVSSIIFLTHVPGFLDLLDTRRNFISQQLDSAGDHFFIDCLRSPQGKNLRGDCGHSESRSIGTIEGRDGWRTIRQARFAR